MALQPMKPNFKQHVLKNLKPGERPAIHHFEFDDESARIGFTDVSESDLWRIGLQKSDSSLWMLVSISPISWKFVGGAEDSPTPSGGSGTSVTWDQIENKPTTRDGFGLLDVYTKTETEQLASGGANFHSEIFSNLNTKVLTLSRVPQFIISFQLNGLGMVNGRDYTVSDETVTLDDSWVIKNSDTIVVVYL